MDTLTDMKLDKHKQISYRSTPEIVAKLDFAAARLANAGVAFGGDKLRTGHLVNAIALWLGEMGDDDLIRFVRPKLKVLAVYLGRSEDQDDAAGLIEAGRDPIDPRDGKTIAVRVTQRPGSKRKHKPSKAND